MILTAAPVTSVASVQLCIIEMRAWVVEDFGMAGSILVWVNNRKDVRADICNDDIMTT